MPGRLSLLNGKIVCLDRPPALARRQAQLEAEVAAGRAAERRRAARSRVSTSSRASALELRRPDLHKPGVLKRSSVALRQQGIYEHHASLLTTWAARNAPLFGDADSLDANLESYLDHFYATGHNTYAARMASYGYAFCHDCETGRSKLPRTHKALKGFTKAAPDNERDPLPWKVCLELAKDLTESERETGDWAAAAALVVQFDTYARLTEVLELTTRDFVDASKTSPAALIIRPADDCAEGDNDDVAAVAAGRRRAAPAESGRFDGMVLVGEDASIAASRKLILRPLLRAPCNARPRGRHLLFPLQLSEYARRLRAASDRLGLQSLRITPHTARHTRSMLGP